MPATLSQMHADRAGVYWDAVISGVPAAQAVRSGRHTRNAGYRRHHRRLPSCATLRPPAQVRPAL
jgi:hypothetical protein